MGGFARLRNYRLSPGGRTWLGRGIALVGYGLLASILWSVGIYGAGGSGGYDAAAYWEAARRAAAGLPLYEPLGTGYGAYGAYLYPPLFAQLLVPFSTLPLAAFVWGWRALELLCLRIAVGSWTRAGWMLLFPPVIAELDAGNVHLPLAAVAAMAMRGNGLPVFPATIMKFASVTLAPVTFVRDRRTLFVGAGMLAVGLAVSFAVSAPSWFAYADFVRALPTPAGFWAIGEEVPLVLRLAIACAIGLLAVRWVRLAPAAVMLALPIVWIASLSILVAVFAPLRATAHAPSETALAWRARFGAAT